MPLEFHLKSFAIPCLGLQVLESIFPISTIYHSEHCRDFFRLLSIQTKALQRLSFKVQLEEKNIYQKPGIF